MGEAWRQAYGARLQNYYFVAKGLALCKFLNAF
jgi:hypothetical protein